MFLDLPSKPCHFWHDKERLARLWIDAKSFNLKVQTHFLYFHWLYFDLGESQRPNAPPACSKILISQKQMESLKINPLHIKMHFCLPFKDEKTKRNNVQVSWKLGHVLCQINIYNGQSCIYLVFFIPIKWISNRHRLDTLSPYSHQTIIKDTAVSQTKNT